MLKRNLALAILLCSLPAYLSAQENWRRMMDDRSANFFQIQEAFRQYYEGSVMGEEVDPDRLYEVKAALDAGTISRAEFEQLAVAINTGTNLPSVATPNGQAAFLFLLTSALAPLIRLSYGRMVIMALPYTIVMGGVGLLCVSVFI